VFKDKNMVMVEVTHGKVNIVRICTDENYAENQITKLYNRSFIVPITITM
jgi:hypothetical protein